MKSILVADTHLGVKQGSSLYNNVNYRLFAAICDYAEEHHCEGLIHLGDFFDNRKNINIKTILTALSIVEMIDRQFSEIRLLVGNHDTIYKDDVHNTLLSMFQRYREDIIVDRPELFMDTLLVPWLFDEEVLKNSSKSKTLMGHFDIAGAVMNESGTISQHGLNASKFKNFEQTYSGHYHTPGKYGNIEYLGSPFHTSFNDVAGVRGFYEYNHDNQNCKFIEFDDYPKFKRIKDTTHDFITKDEIKGNIIELIFTEDHGIEGNMRIIEYVKNMEPLTLRPKYVSIDESMSQEDIADEDIEVKDHLGILHEYYDYSEQPEHIDLKTLNKVAQKIYEETVNGK